LVKRKGNQRGAGEEGRELNGTKGKGGEGIVRGSKRGEGTEEGVRGAGEWGGRVQSKYFLQKTVCRSKPPRVL
jgi:hypothetical protein